MEEHLTLPAESFTKKTVLGRGHEGQSLHMWVVERTALPSEKVKAKYGIRKRRKPELSVGAVESN